VALPPEAEWQTPHIAFKPYPACHFVHSCLDAAAGLGVTAEEVESAEVLVPPPAVPLVLEPRAAKVAPRTPYDAKFSLPFALAHRVVHGRLDLESFTPDAITDPAVLALARRVRPEPFEGEPPSRFAGGTRVVTSDGRSLDRLVPHSPGTPGNPLGDEAVAAKFRACAGLALDADGVDALEAALVALDGPPPIGALREAWSG
jgi:2-methylcitrate dehydratase PrpD